MLDNLNIPKPEEEAFFLQPTLELAQSLIGATLWRHLGSEITGGVIVETEAYISAVDPASHNYRRPSKKRAAMYGPPGTAYIYFTYGMYHCFNVVSEPEGVSAAVLIRAVYPIYGQEIMAARRRLAAPQLTMAAGPGRLCMAFALTRADNMADLRGNDLWISGPSNYYPIEKGTIRTSSRIGISSGQELQWRYYSAGCPAVSGPAALRR